MRAFVTGDPVGLQHLFYYLLQNSFEAARTDAGYIKISSRVEDGHRATSRWRSSIPVCSLDAEETERLFTPFYSTKVAGTGFGLPIARLVATKALRQDGPTARRKGVCGYRDVTQGEQIETLTGRAALAKFLLRFDGQV